MIELKQRLATIARQVPQGTTIIDVGTDHAYLPIFLVQQKICSKAVGVDVHRGPYLSALEQVKAQGLADQITVYFGDGLQPIKADEGNVVVIAGMGGTTIIEILGGANQVLPQVHRLILQPMIAGATLREWLIAHNWAIIDEELVEEEERIYEIIVAERGTQEIPDEVLLELGPWIVAKQDPLLPELIKRKVFALQAILAQLERTQRPEVKAKKLELMEKIAQLQGVLK